MINNPPSGKVSDSVAETKTERQVFIFFSILF